MKKRICYLLSLIMLISSLCACSSKKENKAVATVNGEEISSSIYQYFLLNLKEQIGSTETINGKAAAEYASERAMEFAVKLYVTVQKAESLGVKFTEEMEKEIDKDIEAYKAQAGSDDKYKDDLDEYGLTEDDHRLLLKYNKIQAAVIGKVTSSYTDEQINEFYNNEMVNVQIILFKTVDASNIPLSDDAKYEKKALAEDVLVRINNGENFELLKQQYNEDVNTDFGYMVSNYSDYDEPIINAAMPLELGQVAQLVESDKGYSIIKRFDHVDNVELFSSSESVITSCMFERDLQLWIQSSDIKYHDDVINLSNIEVCDVW